MESTTNTNPRFTNEINNEKRVVADAWNRQWKLRHYWPEIVSENIIAGELEITTEIWVTADVWNRRHDICMKFIAKIDSWLTHGIVKNTMTNTDSEIVNHNSVTVEREINFENWVTADRWNQQRILIHDSQLKSIEKKESSLTHGIVSENCVTTDQKSSAKT